MTRGRQQAAWNHTASLMALLANLHRDPKKRRKAFKPRDFHPDPPPAAKPRKVGGKAMIGFLRNAFVADAPTPEGGA